MKSEPSIRLGLCCAFLNEPIKFRRTTVKSLGAMGRSSSLEKISKICLDNSEALFKSEWIENNESSVHINAIGKLSSSHLNSKCIHLLLLFTYY